MTEEILGCLQRETPVESGWSGWAQTSSLIQSISMETVCFKRTFLGRRDDCPKYETTDNDENIHGECRTSLFRLCATDGARENTSPIPWKAPSVQLRVSTGSPCVFCTEKRRGLCCSLYLGDTAVGEYSRLLKVVVLTICIDIERYFKRLNIRNINHFIRCTPNWLFIDNWMKKRVQVVTEERRELLKCYIGWQSILSLDSLNVAYRFEMWWDW